jgi:hypothetical protein
MVEQEPQQIQRPDGLNSCNIRGTWTATTTSSGQQILRPTSATRHFNTCTLSQAPTLRLQPPQPLARRGSLQGLVEVARGHVLQGALGTSRPGLQAALQHAAAESRQGQIVPSTSRSAFSRPPVEHSGRGFSVIAAQTPCTGPMWSTQPAQRSTTATPQQQSASPWTAAATVEEGVRLLQLALERPPPISGTQSSAQLRIRRGVLPK